MHPKEEHHVIGFERGAPSRARGFVTETLRRWHATDRLDDALLLTSELVSNAIEHGSPPAALHMTYVDAVVRITVRDSGAGRPRLGRLDDPHSGQGRGIALVDAVADGWGIEETGGTGKSVWFTLVGAPDR